MIVKFEDQELRLDEQSGRLISISGEQDGISFIGTTEKGVVKGLKNEIREMSKGIDNWGEGKSPHSLVFLGMSFLGELIGDDKLAELELPELTFRAGERTARWEPLAVLLGDILASFTEEEETDTKDEFIIPMDNDETMAAMQAGRTMNLLLSLGAYDVLAEHLEPGSWPDLVSREILFFMDGKPFYLNQTIETLSKGYKRRVGVAQSIIHDPEILIMDEPTDGLDPNQKHEVRNLIKDMARNKAIIISTHILEEVDAVCTRAIIIADGQILFDGTPSELRSKSDHDDIDDAFHNITLGNRTGPGAEQT